MKTGEKIAALRRKAAELPGGDKKPLVIVALGVIGMLCLLLSSGSGKAEKAEAAPDIAQTQAAVERQLEAMLKTVEGVGKVKVCVTVDRMERTVYAVNTEQTEGEGRNEKSEKYVFTESGSNTQGLVLYTAAPEIRGVAVSCEGGGSGVIRQEVTRLVCAALGITANKIWVTKMQS